jgi:hypothetical protein
VGDDDQQFRDYFERITNAKIGIVTNFDSESYETVRVMQREGGRLRIDQMGAWPEFIFANSIILLDVGGVKGEWLVEDVSVRGVTLVRVTEDLLRP